MTIRFNPKELIDDLMAEGFTKARAIAKAKEESKKRHNKNTLLTSIISRNNGLMERTRLIPNIFL